ncbi:hypothetical protein BDN72DRAFT_833381 [Pluteus cervinus]|uniref:Uncharacterized protein n=1 Tax=Pluteus cervinus TaxID=181527 RepID=A0ACD3B9Z4_9AGAR|nr:hypothetical protein BDN72DRAFT_833381 [Pluteus cervinus]
MRYSLSPIAAAEVLWYRSTKFYRKTLQIDNRRRLSIISVPGLWVVLTSFIRLRSLLTSRSLSLKNEAAGWTFDHRYQLHGTLQRVSEK